MQTEKQKAKAEYMRNWSAKNRNRIRDEARKRLLDLKENDPEGYKRFRSLSNMRNEKYYKINKEAIKKRRQETVWDYTKEPEVTKNGVKHGLTHSPLYNCWASMKRRIKHDPHYQHLSLFEDWNDFIQFRDWALVNGWEDGLTIERKDNDEGYFPNNCIFATRSEQARHRRTTKFDWDSIHEIRRLIKKGVLLKDIAVRFNTSAAYIGEIKSHKVWKE